MPEMKRILFLILINAVFLTSASERVISLSPALTEMVCKLGCEKQLVGRSDVCNYPQSIKKLPVAGRFASPYIEKVIALKPTLIITNDLINPNVIKTFADNNIKCCMIPCRNIAEYKNAVKTLSDLLNVPHEGLKELERIEKNLAGKYKPLDLNVLWVIWDSPLMVAGRNSLPDELLRLSGARNVAANVPQAYFKCSYDWLLTRKIDVIIWTASFNGYKKHRFWSKLDAVKNGKIIHELDHDLVQRPGPRIFEGVKLLHSKLEEMK